MADPKNAILVHFTPIIDVDADKTTGRVLRIDVTFSESIKDDEPWDYDTQAEIEGVDNPFALAVTEATDFINDTVLPAVRERLMALATEHAIAYVDDERAGRADHIVWRVTAADLDTMAGRKLSDDQLDRIAQAIEHSTASDAIEAAVEQVSGIVDDIVAAAAMGDVAEAEQWRVEHG